MPALRKTIEFQANHEVFRVDCLGNLVDALNGRIFVSRNDVPAFLKWIENECEAVEKFGTRVK